MSAASASGSSRAGGDRDQRNAEAPGMGDDVGQLRRLAGIGDGDHRVAARDHAEVAVAASPGWTKNAGVPVEASVAAILRAMWPLLPMPETMTRPLTREQRVEGGDEPAVELARGLGEAGRLELEHTARDHEPAVGGGGCGWRTSCASKRCSWPHGFLESVPAARSRHARRTAGNLADRCPARYPRDGRRTCARAACTSHRPGFRRSVHGRCRRGRRRRSRRGRGPRAGAGNRSRPGPVAARPSRASMASSSRSQRVQVQHVGSGVGLLLVAQLGRAPVRRLLLLGQVDAEQLAAQVGEAVAVGVGARQLARDLGAVDRRAVMPSQCCSAAMSKRAKWNSLMQPGSASRASRWGSRSRAGPAAAERTRWAVPSPAESCTRHSRSRAVTGPWSRCRRRPSRPRSTSRRQVAL